MRVKDKPTKLCCLVRHQKTAGSEQNKKFFWSLSKRSQLIVTFFPGQLWLNSNSDVRIFRRSEFTKKQKQTKNRKKQQKPPPPTTKHTHKQPKKNQKKK